MGQDANVQLTYAVTALDSVIAGLERLMLEILAGLSPAKPIRDQLEMMHHIAKHGAEALHKHAELFNGEGGYRETLACTVALLDERDRQDGGTETSRQLVAEARALLGR